MCLTFPTGTSLLPAGMIILARNPSSPDSNPNVALSVSISARISPKKQKKGILDAFPSLTEFTFCDCISFLF